MSHAHPLWPARAALALGLVAALLLPSCGEEPRPGGAHAPNISPRPFVVGLPGQFREPGVYDQFLDSKGVYLVTNGQPIGNRILVALRCDCPLDGCRVLFDRTTSKFRCPCCGSLFTDDGLRMKSAAAPHSLQRCQISLTGRFGDTDRELRVDPSKRFVQEEQQWSATYSMYLYAE